MNRTLFLTLNKQAFEVMVTGEKKEEFRRGSDWIRSRLYNSDLLEEKEYDFIKFVNGYGAKQPYFICNYEGFIECYLEVYERQYSNGLTVTGIGPGDYIIRCGDIAEKGNLTPS